MPLQKTLKDVRAGFDTIYGRDSFEAMLSSLDNYSLTFDEIAERYGVTKQAVSRWHHTHGHVSSGHKRRHARSVSRYLTELFSSELFSFFYAAAAQHFPDGIEPISTGRAAGSGFRKSAVMLKSKKILLRKAYIVKQRNQGDKIHIHGPETKTVEISRPAENAYAVFYMSGGEFYFIPYNSLPQTRTNFSDSKASKYHKFKNNFSALTLPALS